MRTKLFSLVLILSFSFTSINASIIPEERAESAAKTVFAMKNRFNKRAVSDQEIISKFIQEVDGQPVYYIYNLKPKGFVIVSAEDSYNPILAFSDESHIDFENATVNESLFLSLSRHQQRIEFQRAHDVVANAKIKEEWKSLKKIETEGMAKMDPEGMVVAPLTTTTWNQGQFYNSYCPANADTAIDGPGGGTYAGCSPIAMAQLIKFHNYPPQGNGFNTYEDPDFGPQTVDFCNSVYNWNAMPDSLSTFNDDVAEFIYHVGVSTNTSYSKVYTSTFISYMRDALVFYFGYDEAASWFYDENDQFREVAIQDLDNGRPTILTGTSVFGGAHTWIADGYGYLQNPGPFEPAEYFHFNWGWGGDNNGWFLDTGASWDPLPDQPGSYNITYYEDRYVVHNIFPSENECASLDDAYASGMTSSSAYINATYHYGEQEISFRYRKAGTSTWIETDPTTNYYQYAGNLEKETEYEFQVRRKCCGEKWSDFSVSFFFTTEGDIIIEECMTENIESLFSTSVTDNYVYVYTSQPYGSVPNQFRYKPVADTDWLYSFEADSYFRFLNNLIPGTNYEYQVTHECSNGNWSEYSTSAFFTTTGTQGGGMPCETVTNENLYTSTISDNYAYAYTSQPYGIVKNEFRYKLTSESNWTETGLANTYYRFLSGLNSGSEYEFQVRHECNSGNWSTWSDSEIFMTTGTPGTGMEDCDAVDVSSIYANGTTASFTYMYTLQPYGVVNNQFRYRPVGNPSWTFTDQTRNYYRAASGLVNSTQYEFQVRHECSDGNWSEYSESAYFTTLMSGPSPIISNGENTVSKFNDEVLTYEELEKRTKKKLEFKAYPNPVLDLITIEKSEIFNEDDSISIIDFMGQLVKVVPVKIGSNKTEIILQSLESGIYLIETVSNGEKSTQKIVKI